MQATTPAAAGPRHAGNGAAGLIHEEAVVTAATMARGESLKVMDAEASTIRIDRGEVWLTEHGSFIDHILVAGQSYTFDRPGMAIVAAQVDSGVTVFAPQEGPPPARIATSLGTLYSRPLCWMLAALLWPASWRRPVLENAPIT